MDARTEAEHAAAYLLVAVAAPVAIVVGIRRYRPPNAKPWKLIAPSSLLWARAIACGISSVWS